MGLNQESALVFNFAIAMIIVVALLAIADPTPLTLAVSAPLVLLAVLSWKRMKNLGVWGDR